MDEDRKRRWDVWLGIASPVVTVAGLLVGVWQFNVGERNRVELQNRLLINKDTIDFHRKLWLEKLDTYRNIVVLAGKIAAAVSDANVDHTKVDSVAADLTAAYWGQSVFVEDLEVADALRDFYQTIRDYQGGWADDKKLKIKADRYPMQDDGRPGLSLSGAGRGCNEISGEFTVTRLVRDGGQHLTDLTVEFVQRCDEEPQSLRGTIQVHAR